MTLSVKKLSVEYDDKIVLENVDFSLSKGDFVCITGPNGAGKSTLLKVLSGISFSSTIKAEKLPFSKNEKRIDIAKKVSYLPQSENYAWDEIVFDMILKGRFSNLSKFSPFYTNEDKKAVEKVASFLEISDLLPRNVYSLSGGEFQKCRIARTLCQKADFYLFDEPTANIDIVYENELLEKLKEFAKNESVGVLLSIHNINIALKFAQKIGLVGNKNIIFGSPETVITQKNLDSVYGQGLSLYTHPLWNCLQVG